MVLFILDFKSAERWGPACSKACRTDLLSEPSTFPYCHGIHLSLCEVAAGG